MLGQVRRDSDTTSVHSTWQSFQSQSASRPEEGVTRLLLFGFAGRDDFTSSQIGIEAVIRDRSGTRLHVGVAPQQVEFESIPRS